MAEYVSDDEGVSSEVEEVEDNRRGRIMFIMQSRVRRGQEEFHVFWRDFPSDEDGTWETEESLKEVYGYKTAIADFREVHEQRRPAHELQMQRQNPNEISDEDDSDNTDGFQRGLTIEKVIGYGELNGKPAYFVKWAGTDETDLILAQVALEKAPQQVADFLSSI